MEAYQGIGTVPEPTQIDSCILDNTCEIFDKTIVNKTFANHTVTIKEDKDGKVFITYDDEVKDHDSVFNIPIIPLNIDSNLTEKEEEIKKLEKEFKVGNKTGHYHN